MALRLCRQSTGREQGQLAGQAPVLGVRRSQEEATVLHLLAYLSQQVTMVLEMPAAEAVISRDVVASCLPWKASFRGISAYVIMIPPLTDECVPGLGSAVAA